MYSRSVLRHQDLARLGVVGDPRHEHHVAAVEVGLRRHHESAVQAHPQRLRREFALQVDRAPEAGVRARERAHGCRACALHDLAVVPPDDPLELRRPHGALLLALRHEQRDRAVGRAHPGEVDRLLADRGRDRFDRHQASGSPGRSARAHAGGRPAEARHVLARRERARARAAADEQNRRGGGAGRSRSASGRAPPRASGRRGPTTSSPAPRGGLDDAVAAALGHHRLGGDRRRTAARAGSASPSSRVTLARGPRSGRPRRAARSGAPVAAAIQAPSSSAAQSCSAPPNGTSTPASADGSTSCPSRATSTRDVAGAPRGAPCPRRRAGRPRRAAAGGRRSAAGRPPPRWASRAQVGARVGRHERDGARRDALVRPARAARSAISSVASAAAGSRSGGRRGRRAARRPHEPRQDQLARRLRARQRLGQRQQLRQRALGLGRDAGSTRSGTVRAGNSATDCSRASSSSSSTGAPELVLRVEQLAAPGRP